MYIADMHCDTASELYHRKKNGEEMGLLSNSLCVDIHKLKAGNFLLQNFALYTDAGNGEDPYLTAKNQLAFFRKEMEKNKNSIRQAKTVEEILENKEKGLVSAVLTIEEGEICGGSLEKLEEFYQAGVRMMTFTWNYENSLASEQGLSRLGIAFLEQMEKIGIIPDVSHLSEAGFYDVYRHSRKPFAASHSNARALCGHKRNLTDDMIRKIAEKGGVIGINYYGLFLEDNADGRTPNGSIQRIADHILHMKNVGGISCVGLGSDFDGFGGDTEFVDCSKMELLDRELKRRGLTLGEREAVCFGNVLRIYRECWK